MEIGSCKGDSGAPLVQFISSGDYFMVVGILHGSLDHCEDDRIDVPGLFTRLNSQVILEFITKGQTLIETYFQAVKDGDLNQVKEIAFNLKINNPVDNNGITLLQTAINYGQTKVVVFLLNELQNLGIETAETLEIMDNLCNSTSKVVAKLTFN